MRDGPDILKRIVAGLRSFSSGWRSGKGRKDAALALVKRGGLCVRRFRRLARREARAFSLFMAALVVLVSVMRADPALAAPCTGSGHDVTISASCEFAAGTYFFTGTLTINSGVTVTAQANTTTGEGVTIVSDNIVVNGTISADSQGYAAGINADRNGKGPGGGLTGGFASGGAHGGRGGGNNTNLSYGSAFAPVTLGSGGAHDGETGAPGAGGGAVRLFLYDNGTITLGGGAILTANGGNASTNDHGGGAGGSVWLDAANGTIAGPASGTATLRANGGNAVSSQGGGSGGGGRVALHYATLTNASNITTQAAAGTPGTQSGFFTPGGAGSIFFKAASATNGDLIFDNLNRVNTNVTDQVASSTYIVDSLTVRNGARLNIRNTFTTEIVDGGVLTGGGTQRPRITVAAGGVLALPGASQSISALDIIHRGELTYSAGTLDTLTISTSTYTYGSTTATFGQSGVNDILERADALALGDGEDLLTAAVIDTDNGFAYFGTNTSPGKVVKVDLAEFSIVDTITLESGEDLLQSAVLDAANDFAYFGTSTVPAKVVKIDVSTDNFSRVGAIELDSGEVAQTAVLDEANGFAYFGGGGSKITKVDISPSNFARVGSIDVAESNLYTAVLDTANGFAYFGANGSPAKVLKIDVSPSNFALDDAITLATGEDALTSAVLDETAELAYFGTLASGTARVVKVDVAPSNFSRVGALDLTGINAFPLSAVLDAANGFAYFGTGNSPGKVAKVGLAGFSFDDSITLESGENSLVSAVIDLATGTAYFGTETSPGIVVKVDIFDPVENVISAFTVGSGGTFTQEGKDAFPVGTLTVLSGGNMNHTNNTTSHAHSLVVDAATIDIQSGGTVNVNGLGFDRQQGTGVGSQGANSGGGGGHGGRGGNGGNGSSSAGGITYGSVREPATIGSGGRNDEEGVASTGGGGAAKLSASGTFTLSGTVSANGVTVTVANDSGAGAGGSVWIVAGTLAGTGTVTVNGGASQSTQGGGGGGGGRIAIHYAEGNPLSYNLQARGGAGGDQSGFVGQTGGAGTIFLDDVDDGSSNGELRVDNNNTTRIRNFTDQAETDLTFDSVVFRSSGDYRILNGQTLTVASGGTVTGGGTNLGSLTLNSGGTFNTPPNPSISNVNVTNAGNFETGGTTLTYASATFTNNTLLTLPSITLNASGVFVNNATVSLDTLLVSGSGANWRQISTDNSFTSSDITLESGGTFTQEHLSAIEMSTLVVKSGGILTHANNTTSTQYKLIVSATSADIQTGGSVTADAKGFNATSGTAPGTNGGSAGGGGHGGNGGQSQAPVAGGTTYGSVTAPTTLGSGGGQDTNTATGGGGGGGAIKLSVSGTLTVNGTITANGQTSTAADGGGGAGGSVWLDDIGTLEGNGTIRANGGNGSGTGGGGGGGGRVSITYANRTHSGAVQAFGGNRTGTGHAGGAGTVFLDDTDDADPNGELVVDNNNNSGIGSTSTTNQAVTSSQAYTGVTIRNGARYVIPSAFTLTVATGGSVTGGGATQPILTINSGGAMNLPATTTISSITVTNNGDIGASGTALSYSGGTFTNSGTVSPGFSSLTIGAGATWRQLNSGQLFSGSELVIEGTFTQEHTTTIEVDTVTVKSGGLLTHCTNTTSKSCVVDFSTTTFTVESGGSVNVNNRGFAGEQGPGKGTTGAQAGGGGYGGSGGQGSGGQAGGGTYGSEEEPDDLGSGGGDDNNVSGQQGGAGGGAIKLIATGTFTNDGTVSANGQNGVANEGGGGSGGSIWLIVGTLNGSCAFTANGGAGSPQSSSSAGGGGGGGGRISFTYTTKNCSGAPTVTGGQKGGIGGSSAAAAGLDGTIFEFEDAAPAPTVTDVSHSPSNPRVVDIVTLSGSAEYDAGLDRIEIYLDGTGPEHLKKTCALGGAISGSCSVAVGQLSRGSHTTTVKAYGEDASEAAGAEMFTVAAETTENRAILTRHRVGETSDLTLIFVLEGESTGTLTVTFPGGFTVNSAFTGGSGCLSGFGFTSSTLTATKTSCDGVVTASGASITLPALSGDYLVTFTNDNGSVIIPVVDDDQVNVFAVVAATMSFDIDIASSDQETSAPYVLPLGELSAGSANGSNDAAIPGIWLDVDTNAASGCVVQVRSQNGSFGLVSASAPGDFIASSSGDVNGGGTERYGLCVATSGNGAPLAVVGTLQSVAPFTGATGSALSCGTGNASVGGLTTSFQTILDTASAPIEGGRAQIRVKVDISPTTPAHDDYSDVLTFRATATY